MYDQRETLVTAPYISKRKVLIKNYNTGKMVSQSSKRKKIITNRKSVCVDVAAQNPSKGSDGFDSTRINMEYNKPIPKKFSPYKSKGYASRQASRDGTLNSIGLHKLSR